MNAQSTNSPYVPTTNNTINKKGAVNMETVVSALKKGEKVEIGITSKEMHGEELLKMVENLFGGDFSLSRHEVYGERVFIGVSSLFGYSFKKGYKNGRVESGTRFGVSLGYSAERIANTIEKITAWVESSEDGTKLVVKFISRQVAVEVLEEVMDFFLTRIETRKVKKQDVEEEVIEKLRWLEARVAAEEGGFEVLGIFQMGEEVCEVRILTSGAKEYVLALEKAYSFEEAKQIVHTRDGLKYGTADVLWVSKARVLQADLQGDLVKIEFHKVEVQTVGGIVEGFGIFASDNETMEFIGTYGGVIRYIEKVIGASLLV